MPEEPSNPEKPLITEEIRKIASTWRITPQTFAVERRHIRDFANAIGDSNPLWQDPEFAQSVGYKDVLAPPTFIHAFVPHHHGYRSPILDLLNPGFSASDEIETFLPVQAGDLLTVTGQISGLREKKGRPGTRRMLFIDHSYTYTNERGEVVGRAYWTYVGFEG